MAEKSASWKRPAWIIGGIVCVLVLLRSIVIFWGGVGAALEAEEQMDRALHQAKSSAIDICSAYIAQRMATAEMWAAVPIAGGSIKKGIENSRAIRELQDQIRTMSDIESRIEDAVRVTESWRRENQIEWARLNDAEESEITMIESVQREGGSAQAQRWIDGYEGGRLGDRSDAE